MKKEKTPAQLALEKLTPQQRKFVEEYCYSFNATKSAVAAKYSPKTARVQGSRLLTIVDIQNAVKAVLSTSAMEPEEIAARWTRLAKADLSDFYTRVKVEHTPRIEKRLFDVIEELRVAMDFEQEVAIRSEALISDKKKREKYRKYEQEQQLNRERKLLRLELELERNPNAVRIVNGPTEWKWEMQLDLAKAESLGLLDLVQSITTGPRGTSFSLRDVDAATDNLAKWKGMLTTKIDLTSKGEAIAAPPVLGVMTLEQKKELLEARRRARAQEGATGG